MIVRKPIDEINSKPRIVENIMNRLNVQDAINPANVCLDRGNTFTDQQLAGFVEYKKKFNRLMGAFLLSCFGLVMLSILIVEEFEKTEVKPPGHVYRACTNKISSCCSKMT